MVASSKFFLLPALVGAADDSSRRRQTTCQHLKDVYQQNECCGAPDDTVGLDMIPAKGGNYGVFMGAPNPCDGKKPVWANQDCTDAIANAIEQSGADVTAGYQGAMDAGGVTPITTTYREAGLCPVNVHWHLGAEHRSEGQYDENVGTSPCAHGNPVGDVCGADEAIDVSSYPNSPVRYGFACSHYNADDPAFNTEYEWKHCEGMYVGETYEVHWPHSQLGACNTINQYQTPFYDGVFCNYPDQQGPAAHGLSDQDVTNAIGVQAQVFTIINDEDYYYPDLIRGMIVMGDYGADMAAYTGSTTGTSRDNDVCSSYAPITWQVDRTCHLISASSFDKMCADMKQQHDDMSGDLHAHGAREVVSNELAADNYVHADVTR